MKINPSFRFLTPVVARCLCAGLMACALGTAAQTPDAGSPIRLATDGVARVVIVIPAELAPHPVVFAAGEIKEYLDRITGGNVQVVTQIPPDRPAIVLGEALAAEAGVSLAGIARDGFVIRTIGEKVYVAGKDAPGDRAKVIHDIKSSRLDALAPDKLKPLIGDEAWDFERGTIFGAYAFLEHLGVRWFFPSAQGEVVPELPTLRLAPVNEVQQPRFAFRYLHPIYVCPTARAFKTGAADEAEFKVLGWTARDQRLWTLRNRISSQWLAFNHRPGRHNWEKRFAATHPEYFALLPNGERATSQNGACEHLNYTSAGVLRETVADMDAFFSGQPPETRGIRSWFDNVAYGDTFSLLPNDGLRVDRSPESLTFIREELARPAWHSNYVWQFVAKAGRELKKSHPDKFITCLAYQTYWEVPDPDLVGKLPDNVIVGIAALSGPSSIARFARDGEAEKFKDLLGRWSKATAHPLLFWSYWLHWRKEEVMRDVPMLFPRLAQEFVQTQAAYGKYMFLQTFTQNFIMEHLNKYVMYRLLWNPELDLDALLDDYCGKFYGPAAAGMREFFRDVEARCLLIARNGYDSVGTWEKVFTAEALEDYRARLRQAAADTAGTRYADRVALMAAWFLQPLERGRRGYVDNIKRLIEQEADLLVSSETPHRQLTVDGKAEPRWTARGGKRFFNNVDGKQPRVPATLRIRHSDQSMFLLVEIQDPAPEDTFRLGNDCLELLIDANRDRESFHWLLIPTDGKPKFEQFFPAGPDEPAEAWQSNVRVAVAQGEAAWTVELELPFAALGLDGRNLPQEIGFLAALTRFRYKKDKDRDLFCSSSPILRGSFKQPAAFNRLRFRTHDAAEQKKGRP